MEVPRCQTPETVHEAGRAHRLAGNLLRTATVLSAGETGIRTPAEDDGVITWPREPCQHK